MMRKMMILKSEPKHDMTTDKILMMMMRNMVHIHDEQRSIQIKMSHRDTDKSSA